MSYRRLAEFLEVLDQSSELVRVGVSVCPDLEAAEIVRRLRKKRGPAVLFGDIEGSDIPLVANVLGTESRICRALGVGSLEEMAERIDRLVRRPESQGWFERITSSSASVAMGKLSPLTVKTAACQQVVRLGADVDLGALPAPRSADGESTRSITAGRLVTADVETGHAYVGRHDARLLDQARLAIHWNAHDIPAAMRSDYRAKNTAMPVAIVLGGDPAGLLAAMGPLPAGTDPVALAGLFREKACEQVRCRTLDLMAPADAEIVIEGFVDPAQPPLDERPLDGELAPGPMGYYLPLGPPAVMRVTAITQRANPVFPAIIPTGPTGEATVITRALRRILRPLVRLAIPELVDYEFPTFGAARHWAFVSFRKTHAGQAQRVAHAVWGLGEMMFSKLLVVVDEQVDVHDHGQVWAAIASHVDPGRDVGFGQGPVDPLDSAAAEGVSAGRMVFDATAKLPGERGVKPLQRATVSEEVRRLVTGRWDEYGVMGNEE